MLTCGGRVTVLGNGGVGDDQRMTVVRAMDEQITQGGAEARYARALGDRLRGVRQQQGRSLHEVEADSGGTLKASVVGAYERGERTVSITRLESLAAFYRVPIAELLPPAPSSEPPTPQVRFVIDLVALEATTDTEPVLHRYVDSIRSRRGDYNGKVLTLRGSDLETLSAVLGTQPIELHERLHGAGLLR